MALQIASSENVSCASSIVLIEYQDGSVRPLAELLFDCLADTDEIVEMIGMQISDLLDRGRAVARGPGGSVQ